MNANYVSRRRSEVLARAGSRYSPSAPCAALRGLPEETKPHVFLGKPCDAAAVSALAARGDRVATMVDLILSFFCAGTPSTRGTLDLLDQVGVEKEQLKQIHYRGEGWPGDFRAVHGDRQLVSTIAYPDSWSRLTSYRPLRCHLCPDGLGRLADISCGDAWHRYASDGNPGRSLILVRTEKGHGILRAAARAGYLTLVAASAGEVRTAQRNLLQRRLSLFGRLLALKLLGAPLPRYRNFCLLRAWVRAGARGQASSLAGTIRRGWRRGWYRPANSTCHQKDLHA